MIWSVWMLACGGSSAPEPPAEPAPVFEQVVDKRGEREGLPSPTGTCPAGMALVGGNGRVGMKGQPYGIVETAHLERVVAPERGCPDAIAAASNAHTCWVQTDEVDPVLGPADLTLEAFCIEVFPFPGEGAAYTRDGMSTWDAARFQELLNTGGFGGRRLCDMSEFQAAVAGLKGNHRFVYGDQADPRRCVAGQSIGTDSSCRNPETGVHEYAAVHSHWVVADADFVARACSEPPCKAVGGRTLQTGDLIVAGGTSRIQTRQAPLTPHTWHDHGLPAPEGCDVIGWDDQPVVCADPDQSNAASEQSWAKLVRIAKDQETMTAVLEAGLGRKICSN